MDSNSNKKHNKIGLFFCILLCLCIPSAGQCDIDLQKKLSDELRAMNPQDLIIFGSEHPKATLTVFTDVTCGLCRKLHHDIPKLTEAGIQVRYLAFPRESVGSDMYTQMVSVWCAHDRKAAMERAMLGTPARQDLCQTHPIEAQKAFGQRWGLRGTPMILFADGTVFMGYLPADALIPEALKHGG